MSLGRSLPPSSPSRSGPARPGQTVEMASVGAISDAPDTAADPPSSPPRDAARNLPYELLHSIFLYASTSPSAPHTSRPPHGGAVRSWHSYERAAPLSLVCRRWRPAAQAVLFSSVALVGHEQARRFVDALAGSERARQLAAKETAWVVLALVPADETSPSSSSGDEGDARAEPGRQRAASELLVSALEACSSAAHVHIRTLHHAVRARLLATLMDPGRPLVTMVLGPRNLAAKRWSERLWEVGDGWDLRPSVENLEHTGLIAPWSGMGAPPRAPHVLPPLFPTLALRRVRLWHDWPIEILVAALRSSPHLESVDFYFEQWKPPRALVDAFKVPAKSLREVRYLCKSACLPGRSDTRELADLLESVVRARRCRQPDFNGARWRRPIVVVVTSADLAALVQERQQQSLVVGPAPVHPPPGTAL